MKRFTARTAFSLSMALLAAGPALADRIDGGWCDGKGGHLIVEGPQVRTTGGSVVPGDYDRHSFHYVAPAGEPDAGTEIFMMLRSEEEMTLFRGRDAEGKDGEIWRRCEVTS
ncbi:MAG: hypothetical protein KDJ48_14230 [Nitratireductor sp.]|nr:hypothetical protein [Nitratireductor sp.]MCB1455875.1 hypothetical protein [Nitratireductor sp.]MCB1460393.1 hypothetical protein [Nitratireductor sp.]